jgi:hypothetical protein
VEFSIGASFAHLDVATALTALPKKAWTPAYQARNPAPPNTGCRSSPRDGAWVAEATGLIPLPGWPAGTRLILRKERPHPGAQLRITDADGLRVTGFLTNTGHGGPGRQLADLELRHRRHARVEDRIRAGKDTGLRNLPFHTLDQDRIWVAVAALAADLLAWCARLALPATVAIYEPKRLRLRILASAGRLVRTARQKILHIDPNWPWATAITTAHARLAHSPSPDPDPSAGQPGPGAPAGTLSRRFGTPTPPPAHHNINDGPTKITVQALRKIEAGSPNY